MAKNINHLQHVKSNVVENGLPKLPQPSVIVEGEIAVNYAKDYETLSIKNSSGEVVTFSSDNYYSEKKLGSGFTGENSGITVTKVIEDDERAIAAALTDLDERKLDASAFTESVGDFYTKEEVDEKLGADFSGTSYEQSVTEVISEIETVTAAALNDLNDRKLDMSAYTPTDLSNYYDKDEINDIFDEFGELLNDKVSSITINNSTKESTNGNVNLGTVVSSMTVNGSAVTVTNGAAALTGLATKSELLKYADKAEYNSNDKKIYFKNGSTTLTSMTIDATAFIKDGMVNTVGVSGVTSGGSVVDCLVITFNTDAGKENINIPLSNIFDSSLYYTKTEIDDVLGSGFTVSAVTSSVTDVIKENELIIASALNDLDSKKLDASAYTPTDLSDYATEEWVNDRLGIGFTDSSVTEVFNDTEEVIAEALADLDSRISGNTTYITQVNAKADTIARSLSGYTPSGYSYSKGEVDVKLADKLDASAYTPTDLSGYYTKQEIDEDKLGSGFTGDNSGTTVTDAFNTVERVVAAALTDLDDRKLDASAFTESVGDFYTKEKVDDKLGEWFSGDTPISSVTEVIREDELAISAALNDLEERKLDASAYTQPDLSAYATKQWVYDDVLGSGFTGEYSGKTITEVIEEDELIIASALSDLDKRIDEISGNTGGGAGTTIWNDIGYWSEDGSDLDFSNHTFSELEGIFQGGGDLILTDEEGVEYRIIAITGLGYIFAGNMIDGSSQDGATIGYRIIGLFDRNDDDVIDVITAFPKPVGTIVSGEYSNGTLFLDKIDGTSIEISGFTTGGGGEENVITGITVNNVAQIPSNKVVNVSVPTSLSQITSAHSHSEYALNTAFTAHTGNSEIHVTSTEKSTWNNKQNALSNASVLTGITSQKVSNWDNASASAHSHSNKSVLDNLTQSVIDNNHTHSNKTVLDGITTAKTASWDTVTAKTDNTAFTAHTANTTAHVTSAEKSTWNGKQDAISDLASIRTSAATQSDWDATSGVAMIKNKPTIPSAPGTLTTTATTAQATATNEALSGNIALHKVSKTGSYNDLTNKPTIANYYVTGGSVNTSNGVITLTKNDGTTASVTGLNTYVGNQIEIAKNATGGYDDSYVNVSGDTMTGALTISADTANTLNVIGGSTTGDTKPVLNVGTTQHPTILKIFDDGTTHAQINGTLEVTPSDPVAIISTVNSSGDTGFKTNGMVIGSGFQVSGHTNQYLNELLLANGKILVLPTFSGADNGKILGIQNGQLAWITPTTIYTGTGTPNQNTGNNGDIYLQTS